jgi:hypothetical protein
VNKVIIEKDKFVVDGNTVLAPEEQQIKRRKYEDLEKSRQQINKSKKIKDIKKKKSVITNIFLGFVIGVVIIARYCMIYNYQDTTAKTKAQIEVLNKVNDGYKVQLIKFKNISYIEKVATENLHMVKPRISDIQYYDLSKNNLPTTEKLQLKVSNDIINKIKSFIF